MSGELHLAVIPDGNRRWARSRDRPKVEGHEEGVERMKDLIDWIEDRPVSELTVWGMSKDNIRKRSDSEISYLNDLFTEYARELDEQDSRLHENKIRFRLVGDIDPLEERTQEAFRTLERNTAGYGERTLNVALGYDGRWDISQAVQQLVDDGATVDEAAIRDRLALPEIDVLVGYGGDRAHLSHFANWQVGYATIVFPREHWPDAAEDDIVNAIAMHRERKKSRGR